MLRLQLQAPAGADTVEGIGRPWTLTRAGHYRLAVPKALEGVDKTVALEGELAVPRERVIYCQVLA